VYSNVRAVTIDYAFALLGCKNHDLYVGHLGGEGGEPTGRFADIVESEFNGGLDEWHHAVRKDGNPEGGQRLGYPAVEDVGILPMRRRGSSAYGGSGFNEVGGGGLGLEISAAG
jgi:hypothetical protein